jgi:hypothetical protein
MITIYPLNIVDFHEVPIPKMGVMIIFGLIGLSIFNYFKCKRLEVFWMDYYFQGRSKGLIYPHEKGG